MGLKDKGLDRADATEALDGAFEPAATVAAPVVTAPTRPAGGGLRGLVQGGDVADAEAEVAALVAAGPAPTRQADPLAGLAALVEADAPAAAAQAPAAPSERSPTFSDTLRDKLAAGDATAGAAAAVPRAGRTVFRPAEADERTVSVPQEPTASDIDGPAAVAAEATPASDGPAAPELQYLYRGSDDAHKVIEGLLKAGGGMPDDECYTLANQWHQYLAGDHYDRITALNDRTKIAEAALTEQRKEAEAARSTANQGGLGSLLAAMLAPRPGRKAEREYKAAQAARKAFDVGDARKAEEMRKRLFDAKMNVYKEEAFRIGGRINETARAIRNFNDVYLDAPEAASLKAMVERAAGNDEFGVDQDRVAALMQEIGRGEASAELIAEARRVSEATMRNAKVAEAKAEYEDKRRSMQEGIERQVKLAKENQASFRGLEGFDEERFAPEMGEQMDVLSKTLPTPVDPAAAEGLKKSLEEFAAAVKEGIQNFFRSLSEALSPK